MSEHEYLDITKLPPYEDETWEGLINFGFGKAHAGWIQFRVSCTPFLQDVKIQTSNVYPPYDDMVKWLENIAIGKLPCWCEIDEEGETKTLRADIWKEDSTKIDFSIKDATEDDEEGKIILRARIDKDQLISEFIEKIEDYIANDYNSHEWFWYSADNYPLVADLSTLNTYLKLRKR